jgi:hypothetical protein
VQRLRDTKPSPGSPEAILVEAIKASLPVEPSLYQQRRVLERVLDRQRARHGGAVGFLRPVVMVGVLLVAGATAAATFGHTWIVQGLRTLGVGAPIAELTPEPVSRQRRRATPVAELIPGDAAELEPAAETAPRPAVTHATAKPATRAHALRPEARTTGATETSGTSEDPSLVVDAIRALRTDHDSRRASTLLAAYLRTYPHGALSEEAVALSIEAAAAAKSPSASTFAAQYLREYPHGRFRHAAEQALEQRQP